MRRQHVDFVDDVNLVFKLAGNVTDAFLKVADLTDTGMRGAVDLHHIQVFALGNPDHMSHICCMGFPSSSAVQLITLARIRAVLVLPQPRGPEKR